METIVPVRRPSFLNASRFFLVLLLALCGCTPKPARQANSPQKSFLVRGRVVATDAATGAVTLDHEAIPGYMEAMTMSYKLAAPDTLGELHPGDRITAHLLVDETRPNDPSGYRNPRLDEVVIVAQARPDYRPAVQYHVPQAGDAVPDFRLLNQNGAVIHLGDFKGRVLLLTFIYTRCPLADYCPRMSKNFAELDRALAADPGVYASTHLLSISFDPAYDTPQILRSYGAAYTGRHIAEDFKHWDFAVPPARDLPAVTQFFNVGLTPGETPTSLSHSLSTILIGRDGKIAAWYPSNDWKTDDLLAQVRALATAR